MRREVVGWWIAVVAAAVTGLLLRIASAQGGLWTDEAWSSIYAAEAQDAAGVFLRINHDNNHHLYSLWFQFAGWGASPLLVRAPAIAAGTIGIILAALIAGRKSPAAGIVAAFLCAVSPTFVAFSSEARGYAFMLLATLAMILLVLQAAERGVQRSTAWWLGLISALGMLSHMTMAAPVALITLWHYLDRRSVLGSDGALRETLRLMGPALGAAAAVVMFVLAAAAASPTGMRIGGYLPFRADDFLQALGDIASATPGLPLSASWLAALLAAILALGLFIRQPAWMGSRARLYAVLILGVPMAIGIIQPGNAGFARYYLCSAVGLLLLVSAIVGHGLCKSGAARLGSVIVVAAMVSGSLAQDFNLIELQRGDPNRAVQLMASMSPGGARVATEPRRFEGFLRVAAHRAGYAVGFNDGCSGADFVLMSKPLALSSPSSVVRCGVRFHYLGSSDTVRLTGDAWLLYAAERLQSVQSPVSGPVTKAH